MMPALSTHPLELDCAQCGEVLGYSDSPSALLGLLCSACLDAAREEESTKPGPPRTPEEIEEAALDRVVKARRISLREGASEARVRPHRAEDKLAAAAARARGRAAKGR